jgi:3-oxoacyl-[acyl-carrier-protein] synthase-3
MKYSRILGSGRYLPTQIMTNADLESLVDTTDEWIKTRSGIESRHIASPDEGVSMMAKEACLKAMAMAECDPSHIDLIIVATATAENAFPSTASLLQHQLGLNHVPAFDVSAACAGFNYALGVADQFIRSGSARYALVVGSETLSRVLDWSDRSTCVLFGDGAGAVVLGADNKPGIISTHLHSDGAQHDILFAPNPLVNQDERPHAYLQMNGKEVFKHAVKRMGDLVEQTLQGANIDASQLDWLIPHQANLRIIKAIAKRIQFPMEKVIVTLDKHGNTSAASIPLALDVAVRDGRVKRGDLILFESFGGGLVWGSALIRF